MQMAQQVAATGSRAPVLTRQRTADEVQESIDEVKEHLRKLGLAEYAAKLIEDGYDDWPQITNMPPDMLDELCTSLEMKKGHAARLKTHVHNAQLLAKSVVDSAENYHEDVEELFARMDANEDGTISKAELLAYLASGGKIEREGDSPRSKVTRAGSG